MPLNWLPPHLHLPLHFHSNILPYILIQWSSHSIHTDAGSEKPPLVTSILVWLTQVIGKWRGLQHLTERDKPKCYCLHYPWDFLLWPLNSIIHFHKENKLRKMVQIKYVTTIRWSMCDVVQDHYHKMCDWNSALIEICSFIPVHGNQSKEAVMWLHLSGLSTSFQQHIHQNRAMMLHWNFEMLF